MNKKITKFGISMVATLDNIIDGMQNQTEMAEQIDGDLYYNGINTELKEQVVKEITEILNRLVSNIIIATHE